MGKFILVHHTVFDNSRIWDDKDDFVKLYQNFHIIFEMTFIVGLYGVLDVAECLTALGTSFESKS